MKKLILLLLLTNCTIIFSQEKEKEKESKFKVSFSGFVNNDFVYNTRQVHQGRKENQFILTPMPVKFDSDGKDINDKSNFNFVSINTRLRTKIVGPDFFGAKTSALVEGDFLGINSTTKFTLRLRHAYMKFKWETSEIIIGQYWHPFFVPACFPKAISHGAGVPFNPLSRNPQIRFTKTFGSIKLIGAALAQGHFVSKAGQQALQNSVIPEMHAQIQYDNGTFLAGAGANYLSLMPSIESNGSKGTFVTDETVNTLSYIAFMKIKTSLLTVKLYGMYGQGGDSKVLMGGYYVEENSSYKTEYDEKGVRKYTPINMYSTWLGIHTNGKTHRFGLLVGYSENLGATEKIQVSDKYKGRWGNVNSMFKIAPRYTYRVGAVKIGAEVEYMAAEFALAKKDNAGTIISSGYDDKGVVTNFKKADNVRFVLSVKYIF